MQKSRLRSKRGYTLKIDLKKRAGYCPRFGIYREEFVK